MLLRTDKLSINFGGLWAVKDIDFEIEKGQIVGLIGPNGSGKTTFFNLLSGIYSPTHGEIHLGEKKLSKVPPHRIRYEGIARTFQSSKLLWELSILDNILSGMYIDQKATWIDAILFPKKSQAEIEAGMEKANTLLSYFNEGLIKRRFEKAKNIPHIDRRRLEICRALASGPKLLLLDEPSAGLNREETMEMMEDISGMRKYYEDISIIIIEHDMGVISKVSDKVVAFNYGKKITEGVYSEVSRNEEVRKAYLGGDA